MAVAIQWTSRAQADLRRLPEEQVKRIDQALGRLAMDQGGHVKKLAGPDPEWRLRVGDWRVRFAFTRVNDVETILVLRVLPCQSAYRE
jgi:mRNA interferase RelE/StbE